jgi:hypothetical protein
MESGNMPAIARFYGIIILMFVGESRHHEPHFHARYGSYKASFAIDPLRPLAGKLPPRAERFVLEWAAMHGTELLDNWLRAGRHEPLTPISPLE